MRAGLSSVVELGREFRVSRPTAYRWRRRFRTGRRWLERRRRRRLRRPTWGARKLRHRLGPRCGPAGLPAVATLGRWLKRWGRARGRRRRRPGRAVRAARCCHAVGTVDFKGWYRTGDGRRVDPLTVRDLHSRYGLRIALLEG